MNLSVGINYSPHISSTSTTTTSTTTTTIATNTSTTLDDQTQADSKPAGQPEHASLNHCHLIASARPELVLWAPPACGGDKVSL